MTVTYGFHPLSPDGRVIAAPGPDGQVRLYPVDGKGDPQPVPGIEAGELPIRFSVDGRSLFVFRQGQLPARISRVETETGRRELLKEIAPLDVAGLLPIQRVLMTADGRSFAYNTRRVLSELYVADGLRVDAASSGLLGALPRRSE